MKVVYKITPVLHNMLHNQAILHDPGDISQVICPVIHYLSPVPSTSAPLWAVGLN